MAQRIQRGAAATLTYLNTDGDGAPVDADGTMTVRLVNAAGTVVLPALTPTTTSGTGKYSVTLTPTQTAQLDLLTARWSDSSYPTAWHETEHEICGGFLLSLADIRGFDNLDDETTYPTPAVLQARREVEDEAERICAVSFVPRYRRLVVDGPGDGVIIAGVNMVRTVRGIRTFSSAGSSTFTDLTAGQLAGLVISDDGRITRTDGNAFSYGVGNIVVDLEHGLTDWGQDLVKAALIRLADVLTRDKSNRPDRAKTYRGDDGFGYDLADIDEYSTGIPAVDAVYDRYSRRSKKDGRQAPASRPLNYDPSYFGLYNGGRR